MGKLMERLTINLGRKQFHFYVDRADPRSEPACLEQLQTFAIFMSCAERIACSKKVGCVIYIVDRCTRRVIGYENTSASSELTLI